MIELHTFSRKQDMQAAVAKPMTLSGKGMLIGNGGNGGTAGFGQVSPGTPGTGGTPGILIGQPGMNGT